ncbi:hypothetical protein Nepgr_027184 [Nepenthes gracilis]|uniref:Uncharacterized protein n=1 Tax=Nepenthes gracilis TaxID=150966 RepID=A0AAD3TAX3_NEPGR|nr:hypothetical protein Nepgr_027184 [Nepenthes gracilis]
MAGILGGHPVPPQDSVSRGSPSDHSLSDSAPKSLGLSSLQVPRLVSFTARSTPDALFLEHSKPKEIRKSSEEAAGPISRPEVTRKGENSKKSSGRRPPSASAGLAWEGLMPRNSASYVVAGGKITDAVPVSNSFATLQSPETSTLRESFDKALDYEDCSFAPILSPALVVDVSISQTPTVDVGVTQTESPHRDKLPLPKVVRFAPDLMTSEAPNCASRYRKMAPFSDVYHPSVLRSPNPDTNAVCHYEAEDEVPSSSDLDRGPLDVLPTQLGAAADRGCRWSCGLFDCCRDTSAVVDLLEPSLGVAPGYLKTPLVATGHLDGMTSGELPTPDGAEGVLIDVQSHLPVAPASSGLPDAHLKGVVVDVLTGSTIVGFIASDHKTSDVGDVREASIAIVQVPVDSISISPEENVDILVNSTLASGMSGRSEDHSLDSVLNLSPQEGTRTAPGNISSSEVGPISLPLQADADPPTDPAALVDSVVQSSDATPFKALDQALFLKRVRFTPEILSAEAPSSAPHRRMLASCSDTCHPIKFRRSNLGNLASEDVPVDDGPNPGADIEYHDLLIPPSDGVTREMEPASVINSDLTPSPISRILNKYVGSSERAKKKTRSRIKSCKSK